MRHVGLTLVRIRKNDRCLRFEVETMPSSGVSKDYMWRRLSYARRPLGRMTLHSFAAMGNFGLFRCHGIALDVK